MGTVAPPRADAEEALKERDPTRELDHRFRNILAMIQAMAQQTLRGAPGAEDFGAAFMGRLRALSGAYELVARNMTGGFRDGVLLQEAFDQALAPLGQTVRHRITTCGPDVRLGADLGMTLQLAVHELASNALQHGALGAKDGQVDVGWRAQDGELIVIWVERGGPPAAAPERRGFGLRLVQDGLPRTLGGKAQMSFGPEGLELTLKAPLSDVLALC